MERSTSLMVPMEEIPIHSEMTSSSSESQSITPYRLQLEGRRRLNTLERFRERRQNIDLQQYTQPPPPTDYNMKTEEIQDPIIRRALERFDEQNRALSQLKPNNYDEVQDPITRRALMRLESNLKRTIPSSSSDLSHESSFTNSYTLGSLHSPSDARLMRPTVTDASLPPPVPNHKPSHLSVHQRFCSNLSNHTADFLPSEQVLLNGDPTMPLMRLSAGQPIYVASNFPIHSVRQRSRSEDFIATRDLTLHQTKESEEMNSSDDHPSTPTVPSATRPEDPIHQSESSESTMPMTNAQPSDGDVTVEECDVQPLIDACSLRNSHLSNDHGSSAFIPVHSSANPYYSQQNLPNASSYTAMYTPNNANQAPYTDDPM